ncbi:MAG: porin [Deltaproteobacteria bacterium]|nr:porin [Deltaproteobacteria bacterium]
MKRFSFLIILLFLSSLVGAAELDVHGFAQMWYLYRDNGIALKDANNVTYYLAQSDSRFVLSRARLRTNVELSNVVSFFGQIDFMAYQNNVVNPGDKNDVYSYNLLQLMDLFLNVKLHDYITLRFGQFTIPFGYEIMRSPYDLELVSYSLVVGNGHRYYGRQLGFFPYLRDTGVYAFGDYKGFNYKLGIVNGAGIYRSEENRVDISKDRDYGNKFKDLVGRIGYNHKLFSVGLSGYYGLRDAYDDFDANRRFWRGGFDLTSQYKNIVFASEVIFGQDEYKTVKAAEGKIEFSPHFSYGTYVLLGYKFTDLKLLPVVRYGFVEPDDSIDDNEFSSVSAAINYYFSEFAKLTLAYEKIIPVKAMQYINKDGKASDINLQTAIMQLGVNF